MSSIAENITVVNTRIAEAAAVAGRPVADIGLITVTKMVDIPQVEQALSAGCVIMGENRVQEADRKLKVLAGQGQWHLIGHLQKNKAKKAVELFDVIHSVDTVALAAEINRRAGEAGKKQQILLQVNTSGEESKFGVAPEDTEALVRGVVELPHLDIRGLMTIGAFLPDPEDVRPCFKLLCTIKNNIDALNIPGVTMDHLSMGMTNDYTVAIEEGATLVRVGRAIFGERN